MYLIIGLGNPGKQYDQTRHNLGFRVLDLLAGSEPWLTKKGFNEFIKLDDILLAKPQMFMNKSGIAVKDIFNRFDDPQLIVIHDELDLPLGSMKVQKNVSSAGHNGIQSIIDELRTKDFIRIRLGINNPNSKFLIPNSDEYVLQKFTDEEEQIVKEVLEKAKDAVEVLQTQGLEIAQSKFNG